MNTQEFIKTINALRLENKGQWYQWQGVVNGKQVTLKGYSTWMQRLNVDGISHSSGMDISVREFKEFLHVCAC